MPAFVSRVLVTACVLCCAAGTVAGAARGQVVDPEGNPVENARACFVLKKKEMTMCARTDERGFYELPPSHAMKIEVSARGFLPLTIAAVDQDAPVALSRAARLRVRIVDARTGEAIRQSEVALFYPSGAGKGPVPANASGVILGTLPPGEVVVVARAIGYREGRSDAIALEGGTVSEAVLELEPATDASPEPPDQREP
jgi:hypothetical protein